MGYLYIITNESFKGFVKIGVTEDIKSRLHTYQTSSPYRNYKVEFYVFHPKCYEAERRIKEAMKMFALSIKNEWYEISIPIAISRLEEQVEDFEAGLFD